MSPLTSSEIISKWNLPGTRHSLQWCPWVWWDLNSLPPGGSGRGRAREDYEIWSLRWRQRGDASWISTHEAMGLANILSGSYLGWFLLWRLALEGGPLSVCGHSVWPFALRDTCLPPRPGSPGLSLLYQSEGVWASTMMALAICWGFSPRALQVGTYW